MKRSACSVLFVLAVSGFAMQQPGEANPEMLIAEILRVDSLQRASIGTLIMDAETSSGKREASGFVEAERFVKRLSIKYLPDTTWYREQFLRYFKDGQEQDARALAKAEAKERDEAERRKNRNISAPLLRPFAASHRPLYMIEYKGIVDNINDAYQCHHFVVTAKEAVDSLINGDFYFEIESHHLALAEFSPSKLVKKTMFRLSELRMSVSFLPDEHNNWLPRQFELSGKGKAALFIGVQFAVVESYTNHRLGEPLADSLFLPASIDNR